MPITARRTAVHAAFGMVAGLVVAASAHADQVTLEPIKDNSLFSNGTNSNGA